MQRNTDGIENEQVDIWLEEWQSNIWAQTHREHFRSRSRGEDDEQDRTRQKHLATRKLGNQTRALGEASGLVGLAGCAEGHTSRESAPTWAKVDRRTPSTTAWTSVATREVSRTDPAQFPNHRRGKGQEKSEGKGKGDKGGKGKMGQLSGLGEYPCW